VSGDVMIKGGAELAAFLQGLPVKMEKNIMRAALAAGARAIAKEVKALAPDAEPSSENARIYGGYAGALRDSVRVSTRAAAGGKITATVKVGGVNKKGADVFYVHFVEYGTRPHLIKPSKKRMLELGGKFARIVSHPGAKPHPFVRPAFDAKSQAAVEAAAEKVRSRLTAQGIDVPAPATDEGPV
jgi:HK97 gp10 family phage protein